MNIRVDRRPLLTRHLRKLNWIATNRKRKPPMKAKSSRFDNLVARYYPAVYNFASRLTDDPREAVLLTYRAFNSIRKQLWLPRNEIALVRILLKDVVRSSVRDAAIEWLSTFNRKPES